MSPHKHGQLQLPLKHHTADIPENIIYDDVIMALERMLNDWPFVRGIHRWEVDSPHKGIVMRSFDVFVDHSLHKLLNK